MKTSIEIYLALDTETGGLKAGKYALLEIACCPFDKNLNDLPEYSSGIIKPYGEREVSDGALNTNGITREQIEKEGRDPKEVFKEFSEYIKSLGSAKKIHLVGHNLDFDISFIDDFFEFYNKDLSKYVNDKMVLDTMWWSRMKWNESTNYKLVTCAENAGVELVNAHRALADTRATKDLMKLMIKSLRSENIDEEEKRFRNNFQFQY